MKLRPLIGAVLMVCAAPLVIAHGGEDHGDAPASNVGPSSGARLEAHTETFELVANVVEHRLSVMVDRYETNEPVLGGTLEIESGELQATARFDPVQGDYVVDDEDFVHAISAPGKHPMVFTLVVGEEGDLIEGTLDVPVPASSTGWSMLAWIGGAGGIALAAAAIVIVRRRRNTRAARSHDQTEPVAVRVVPARGRAGAAAASVALLVAFSVVALAGPGAHGPNGEHLDAQDVPVGPGLMRLPDGSVNVPKLAQRRMGVRTVLAPLTEAAATVELAGRVAMDPNAGGRVQPTHGGRIEPGPDGLPLPGQSVRQGEILAYVRHHSDPFTQAMQQAQLAELEVAGRIAADRLRRLEALEGSVAGKDIDAARAEAAGYRARVHAMRSSLDARQQLRAPITGVVASARVVIGQVVEATDVIFEIVDPNAWVVDATTADVSIAARIGPAKVLGVPGLELELVGAGRSLRDGVLPLTFRTQRNDAKAPSLAIGQSVTVIATLTEKSRGVRLPASSIVRSAVNEPVVWIKTGAERYLPQPIQYRPLDSATVLVTNGLGPDNRVVVEGASLIAQIR